MSVLSRRLSTRVPPENGAVPRPRVCRSQRQWCLRGVRGDCALDATYRKVLRDGGELVEPGVERDGEMRAPSWGHREVALQDGCAQFNRHLDEAHGFTEPVSQNGPTALRARFGPSWRVFMAHAPAFAGPGA